jgi:hypothetical protein
MKSARDTYADGASSEECSPNEGAPKRSKELYEVVDFIDAFLKEEA